MKAIPRPEAFIGDIVLLRNSNRQAKIIKANLNKEDNIWEYMVTDHGFSFSRRCLDDVCDEDIRINLSKMNYTK